MESNKDVIEQKDGHKTVLYHFFCKDEPKACIIILHGMAEHHNRYYPFADFLVSQGIDVYLYDHIGHGTDKTQTELGFFSNTKGYEKVIEHAQEVINFVTKNKRCKKVFLMGHSMGSIIARNIIPKYDKLDGVILCGTTHPPKAMTQSGLFLSSLIQMFRGSKHRSPFINNLMFGGKPYAKLRTRTSFDWLSRSNPAVGAYINDPYCGFLCTISFYHDLIKLTSLSTKISNIKKTRKNLPIFIISGDDDPVGGCGKEINHLLSIYNKYGYQNVSSKLYPQCRHELLQELNATEVMNDITTWLTKQ